MKTKTLAIVAVLIIAFAAMTLPAMAVPVTDSKGATVTGSIAATMSLAIEDGPIDLTLDPLHSPATNSAAKLNITSNYPGWSVTAKDDTNKGHMNQTTDSGTTFTTVQLASPMSVGVATVSHMTGSAVQEISGSTVTAATSSGTDPQAAGVFRPSLTFSQPVSVNDPVLTDGQYLIVVTFAGTTP